MSEAIPSVVEDRQAIEKTINGMIRLAEGYTRRKYPLRHCLRIAQCEELIPLCDRLKQIAEEQLVIKRDKQGTKSKLEKKRLALMSDLEQINSELGYKWPNNMSRGSEVVTDEDTL